MPTSCLRRLASLLLLLPWLLGSCTVYDHFFHPHRLGSPPMTPQARAKAKAADKARHKGLTLGAPAATDGTASAVKTDEAAAAADGASAPEPAAAKADSKDNTKKYSDLPDNIRNTYDKKLLLKRSFWQRMQYHDQALHHYAKSSPQHTEANRADRKMRKHPKGKGKAAPKDMDTATADAAPEPDPTQPAAAPAPKASKAPAATKAAAPAATKTAAKAPAHPAPRVVPKPKPTVKPQPRPAAKPAEAAPTEASADEPPTEDRAAKKEKPAKKPKRDKNGNKLPKADPTQPPQD